MEIVLATSNPAKVERLRWLLADLPGLELITKTNFPVPEDATSLCENAFSKARAYAASYSATSIATDGGLVVPALGSGWNPVLTGRRSGLLLEQMSGLVAEQRAAFQAECVAVVDPGGRTIACLEATSSRRYVADSFRPDGVPAGFWLPGLLLYGPGRKRLAELTAAERALIDDHWLGLRDRLRAVMTAAIAGPASSA